MYKYKYIGGAPRCGKTTISNTIGRKNNFEIIHLDDYRINFYNGLNKEEQKKEIFNIIYFSKNFPKFHKIVFNFFKKNNLNIEIIKKLGFKDYLETYIKIYGLNKYFEEEFKGSDFITRNILENDYKNKVIEGVSLSPEIIYEYLQKGDIKENEIVFLIKSCKYDVENILNNFPGSFSNRNIKNMVDLILRYSEKIEKKASKLGLKIIDTSNTQII